MYRYMFAPKAKSASSHIHVVSTCLVHPRLKTVLNPFHFFHCIIGKLFVVVCLFIYFSF